MGKNPIRINENPKYSEDKAIQNIAIKKRLARFYRELEERPSIYSLQRILAKMDDGFVASYNTLNDMLSESPSPTTPNLHLVLALCRYWNLDYATIFAPASQDRKPVPSSDALAENLTILNDRKYFGKFYGYMYTKNIKRKEIIKFTLQIDSFADSTLAKLITYSNPEKVSGEMVEHTAIYKGIPVLIPKKKIITMTLTDDEGQFYSFFFDYRAYNVEKLYYRKGIAITSESESDKPLLCNFVLFQNELSKEKCKKFIPGLLPLTDDYFIIKKSVLNDFANDEEMASFFKDYSYNWQGKEDLMIRIRFSHVLKSIDNEADASERNRVIKALLRLQEKCQSPNRIEYANPEGMPGFAKTYLQREK